MCERSIYESKKSYVKQEARNKYKEQRNELPEKNNAEPNIRMFPSEDF
jgi:hypothetical protein